jgi:predicted DCC family thiol-disulfide oxidoreductase YuxK
MSLVFHIFDVMSSDQPTSLTVYFDGECPICSREIAMYRKQVGACAIAWVDAATCPASTLGTDLSRQSALARLHVRTADGELKSGALAFSTLWRSLPRFAFVGRLMSHRPVLALLEVGYRVLLVARRTWRRSST